MSYEFFIDMFTITYFPSYNNSMNEAQKTCTNIFQYHYNNKNIKKEVKCFPFGYFHQFNKIIFHNFSFIFRSTDLKKISETKKR